MALPAPVDVVATTGNHTCARLSDGALWCWGANFEGQLAQDDPFDSPDILAPTRVGLMTTWTAVACSDGNAGGMRCWGRNVEGQLGTGAASALEAPVAAGAFTDWIEVATSTFFSCGQRADGSVWCTGDNVDGQLGTGDRSRRSAWTAVTLP